MDEIFSNDRYITRGIEEKVSKELQLFLWNCIDSLKENGHYVDYLQVFEISTEKVDDVFLQKVEHRQAMPKYKRIYRNPLKDTIDEIIFVIDDGKHTTMMFSKEF